ncbi:MAG: cytochrome ubiquinol oxidase subunit I, partial [Kiloniellaceae bacterium]
RLQFGLTAMYHFLFVPLTIGLSVLLAVMESVYVMTGHKVWRDMTRFWGMLFGINFAMGVATGLTLEFQFGTNWAYFSHYVGDVFGAPLAIEGMMAFFLEATFVGLFFFGWDRLSRLGHLAATWMVAIGANLSALWILVANAWMQNPVGARFNPETMRMEITSFFDIFFNPVAQSKFVHTVSAGYVTGAVFVLAVSAFYLLRGRDTGFAKRSMTVAASFGLASALSVVVLGDESGYTANHTQKMKIAAFEAEWETHPAPAGFNVFALPDMEAGRNRYELKIPWVLGLIATRSVDTVVPGINDLVEQSKEQVHKGVIAYEALQRLRANPDDVEARRAFEANWRNFGYALLLKRHNDAVIGATDDQVAAAARDTVPSVLAMFWTFRFMVGIGFFLIALFALAFYLASARRLEKRWFLWLCLLSLPLPWIASELGWFVAEHGRQPWLIEGILPTYMGVSSVSAGAVWSSLIGFVLFYSALAVVDVFLMIKYIRIGPYGKPPGEAAAEPAGAAPTPGPAAGSE